MGSLPVPETINAINNQSRLEQTTKYTTIFALQHFKSHYNCVRQMQPLHLTATMACSSFSVKLMATKSKLLLMA